MVSQKQVVPLACAWPEVTPDVRRPRRPLLAFSLAALMMFALYEALPASGAASAEHGETTFRGAQSHDVAFIGGGKLGIAAVAAIVGGILYSAQACGLNMDMTLLAYFALWYLGNYHYNITNKRCLNAAGGSTGFPLTISTLQLGVGTIYAGFLWAAPDARAMPSLGSKDLMGAIPVAVAFAGAHCASVFAFNVGGVSFGQIVKAAEPAFVAATGVMFYGSSGISQGKKCCLIPVIGGVVLASLGELDFSWMALGTASMANLFAAVKGFENSKLLKDQDVQARFGCFGNQFAVTVVMSFFFCIPVAVFTEGQYLGHFFTEVLWIPEVMENLIWSGLTFYWYNELATMTLKKVSAVTNSVANTAKRVIVIVGVAIVLGESLAPLKLVGCFIGIAGAFLYSVIDHLTGGSK